MQPETRPIKERKPAHPPIELEDWPDEDRRSRLVFITRGLTRAAVEQLFAGVAAVAASEPARRR